MNGLRASLPIRWWKLGTYTPNNAGTQEQVAYYVPSALSMDFGMSDDL